MLARLAAALAVAFAFALSFSPAAHAQRFQPGSPYICPNTDATGLDCYLDAVVHLYRMCRHVKSIEIIEFGYADAQKGVNGAKSDYCVDKQKINITRPYQAALREATPWAEAVDHLRDLQAFWTSAMGNLRWRDGEDGPDYEYRVDKVFEDLSYKVDDVRVAFTTAPASAVAKGGPAKSSSRAASRTTSKASAKAPAKKAP